MTLRKIINNISLWAAIVALLVFCLFPIVELLSYSFKPQNEWGEVNIIPKNATMQHYKDLLNIGKSSDNTRKQAFDQQMNAARAQYRLNDAAIAEIKADVDSWIEQTSDPYVFLGKFKEYQQEYLALQEKVKQRLISEGIDSPQANAIAKKSIIPSVDSKALSILPRLDTKQDRQKETLQRYQDSGFKFTTYFKNSMIFSMLSSLVAVSMAIFGAYALARIGFYGREIISKSVLLTYMVGGVLLLVPLFQMASQMNLLETPVKRAAFVMAIYVMQTLPVSLYMLGNYFRTISFSLEEAAAMDGYGRVETIFKVVLPLSLPMVATVFVYCFIIAWNEYLFMASFLKETKTFWTLPIALKSLNDSANDIKGLASAASILTLVPAVVLFGFVMKHVTGGLSEGGVKE